jgi:hypothetical protein
MVAQSPGVEVREITGANHMAMLSRAVELVQLLIKITDQPKDESNMVLCWRSGVCSPAHG